MLSDQKLILELISYFLEHIVREAEVILLTFSRGESILLSNCPLDVK